MVERFVDCFAYIDPASGAIVLQAILASMLALGVIFRRVVFWPLAFLFGKKRKDDAGLEAAGGQEEDTV